ncbi:MAG: flagellar hook protein FlgE [Alphaproteobacteria bacterium]|nr:flagellar hook protein FlgE [Alphaproteobacteria bacterium]|tara:strand:- start:4463 stop:5860 length:1398 start_codon:yes stop_codon:yes gene_type:complete
MSLGSALNASVSGLQGQGAAIAAVSENIANASTTAYKKREVSFQSLVTGSTSSSSINALGGGVTFSTNQNMTEQGLVQNTGVSTNVAINGNGFFVVTQDPNNQPSGYTYTRNGAFKTNEDGLLINNEGSILLGQRTDENGNVTAANNSDLNSLEPVDLNAISGTAGSTEQVSMEMNLPADSSLYAFPAGPEYITAHELFDELGLSHTVEQTWRKTGVNEWVVEFSDPYQTSLGAGSGATGDIDLDDTDATIQNSLLITFNGDGSVNEITTGNWDNVGNVFDGTGGTAASPAEPFNINVRNLTTGADDITYEMNFGTSALFDGLTQFASNTDTPDIEISTIEQDGVRFGQLSGVEIDGEGIVTALFDNGVRRPIFQIPIATFPNPEGLTNVKGTIYDENENAGELNLRLPNEGNAGAIEATSIELSTVDTSDEFNKMIIAQQAYSSAAQILSTVDEMFDTLIGAVR